MKSRFSLAEKTFFGIGLLFIFAGIVCNEWVLTKIFSQDGVIDTKTYKILIWTYDITLVLLGFTIIVLRKKYKILIFLFSIIMTIAILESACFILNSYNDRQRSNVRISNESIYSSNQDLGYKLKPNRKQRQIKSLNDKIVYDIIYSTDGCGRIKFCLFESVFSLYSSALLPFVSFRLRRQQADERPDSLYYGLVCREYAAAAAQVSA